MKQGRETKKEKQKTRNQMGETKKEGLKRRNEKGKPRMRNLGGVFKYREPRGRNQEGRSLSGNEEMGEPRKSGNQEEVTKHE